jgi:hypothetical protein
MPLNSMKSNKPKIKKQPQILESKEQLELKRLQNELKWSSGWRRILDKFVSPASFATIAALIGAVIAIHNWRIQKTEESLIELQRNLVTPALTRTSTQALLEKGDIGIRTLWSVLSSADSTTTGIQISIVDALSSIAKETKNQEILTKILGPIITSESSKRRGQSDKQSLVFINHVVKKIIELGKEINVSLKAIIDFRQWQKQWLSAESVKLKASLNISKEWVAIPEGLFIDNYEQVSYLPKFLARVKKINPTDSLIFKKLGDSTATDIGDGDFWYRGYLLLEKLDLGKFDQGANSLTVGQDSSVYELIVDPNLEFEFIDKSKSPSQDEITLMDFKFRYGIYGNVFGRLYPYSPESMRQIKYVKYRNRKVGRLELPTNRAK